jgi:hypothetical protein
VAAQHEKADVLAPRSGTWWTTIDMNAKSNSPVAAGMDHAEPARETTRGCALPRAASSRILLGRLDADDPRVERVGQQRRQAPGAGAEVENHEMAARTANVAADRRHPEPPRVVREGAAVAIRAV